MIEDTETNSLHIDVGGCPIHTLDDLPFGLDAEGSP